MQSRMHISKIVQNGKIKQLFNKEFKRKTPSRYSVTKHYDKRTTLHIQFNKKRLGRVISDEARKVRPRKNEELMGRQKEDK